MVLTALTSSSRFYHYSFVARILGTEGYDIVASIFVFSNFFGFVINPSFRVSIVHYVSVYSGSGKEYTPIIAGFLAYT